VIRSLLAAIGALLLLTPGAAHLAAQRAGTGSADTSPRRIVSLIPATTEMLFAMGEGARVVGVSLYDQFPPEVERLAKVGGLLDPDTERLLALKPDLVIVYDTQRELKIQLERAGIPIFNYAHKGLADITETMRALGRRIGAAPAADAAAARIEQRLDAVRARVRGKPRPRTLLVFSREPGTLRQINASAGVGFLHDVLELAGGRDVMSDVGRQSLMLSTELILTRAPELIIELHYGQSLRREQIPNERRVWNALPSVPAVRNGRIFLLSGDEFVIPGPRIVIAAERFADALHPSDWVIWSFGHLVISENTPSPGIARARRQQHERTE
jgi:iron complex transport system substrate-binding protein